MSFRIPGLCALLLFTAGCSSLPSLFTRAAPVAAQPAPDSPAPVPATPPSDGWCQRIAANTRAQAAADGFDAATQERMSQQSFQQCTAMQ